MKALWRRKYFRIVMYLLAGFGTFFVLAFTILAKSLPQRMGDCHWYGSAQAWLDEDGNGEWNARERPLQNVLFQIDDPHSRMTKIGGPAVSDIKGVSAIGAWLPGCPKTHLEVYAEAPAGYQPTSPERLSVDEDTTTFSFGFAVADPTLIPNRTFGSVSCQYYAGITQIRDIAIGLEGETWVTTQKSAIRIDPLKGSQQVYTVARDNGLSDTDFHAVAIAPDGIAWFATHGGAYSFEGNEMVRHTISDEQRHPALQDVFVDHDNYVWFGTTHDGVIRYDPAGGEFTRFRAADGLPSDRRQNMIMAPDMSLWFISPNHISTIGAPGEWSQQPEWVIYNDANHPPTLVGWSWENNAFADDGSLWLRGSSERGVAIARYAPEKQAWQLFDFHTTDGLMLGNYIMAIATASNGSIWLGTTGNGVMQLTPDKAGSSGEWVFYNTDTGLISNTVTSIRVDPRTDSLWFGHVDGVANCTVAE